MHITLNILCLEVKINKHFTWLICSAPVHVKLQVSLQHMIWSGDKSGFDPRGKTIASNPSLSMISVSSEFITAKNLFIYYRK